MVKVVRVHVTGDLEAICDVSVLPVPLHPPWYMNRRYSTERVLLGNTPVIPHCHWGVTKRSRFALVSEWTEYGSITNSLRGRGT